MIILGIETSCDETACGIVELHRDGPGARLLSNVVFSSMDLHAAYGGVVPEIAARSHIESVIPVIDKALIEALGSNQEKRKEKSEAEAGISLFSFPNSHLWDQIDGIAVTYGAGLGGCLLVGVMTARTLAITKNKPLYAINHVEAHIYANFLTEVASPPSNEQRAMSNDATTAPSTVYRLPSTPPQFPLLGLIVSGGHSQLVLWRDHFDYTLLGQTHDDAIGEAFDKVAKIIGLPYPGGPSIEKFSAKGDPFAFNFPKANMSTKSPALVELRSKEQRAKSNGANSAHSSLLTARHSHSYDFSFSGLKTAVLRAAQEQIGAQFDFPSHKLAERLSKAQKADIAASFQRIAVETVVDKTLLAYEEFQPKSVVIGGGVASSAELRRQLADRLPLPIQYTDPKLCTDNGSMIATLGCYKAMLGQKSADPYKLDIQPNLSM